MSRNDKPQTPAAVDHGQQAPSSDAQGVASLLQWAERMVLSSALARVAPDEDGDAPYARAFVLGEALGRRFRRRCANHHGPHGLAVLLEQLACGSRSRQDNPAQASARAGLFSGFCWDIERALLATAEAPGVGDALRSASDEPAPPSRA